MTSFDFESDSSRRRTPSSSPRSTHAPPDPFFTRLAELLPDVDIVVLPPEPRRAAGPPLDANTARRSAEAASAAAEVALCGWWSSGAPGLPAPAVLTRRWKPGSDKRHIDAEAAARISLDIEVDTWRLLSEARSQIEADGGDVSLVKPAVGLLRFRSAGVMLEVHSPPDVTWWSVSATVAEVQVDDLALPLTLTPPTETSWKQRDT